MLANRIIELLVVVSEFCDRERGAMILAHRGISFFLAAVIYTAALAHAGTLTPAYTTSISPAGIKGGLGTIQSGGSSVTVGEKSISATSDNDATEAFGSITWTPSVPMTVTLTFEYQITNPGSSFVIWGADWFGETIKFTDGKVKTFSQSFDISDQISVSVKVKNGSVSITNISVP